MDEILIACSMLKDEIEMLKPNIEIDWMDKGLHTHPSILHQELKKRIEFHSDKKVIYLAYGLCGNALIGLSSKTSKIIIPKFDDCIRILMCHEGGLKPCVNIHSLYFTNGWVNSDRYIGNEMKDYIKRFGEEKGQYIKNTMLSGYKGLKLIDTGAFDKEACEQICKKTAKDFNLEYECVQGTTRVLAKLINKQIDDEFVVLDKGEALAFDHFCR